MVTGLLKGTIVGVQYSKEFLPVASIGENILLYPDRIPVRVEFVEQTGFIVHDFGKLEPKEIKRDIPLYFLDSGRDGLLQLRFFMLDNFTIENFRQPSAIGRFVLKNAKTIFRKDLLEYNIESLLHLTEFFVFKDFYPVIDIRNDNTYTLENSRIVFFGYRYVIEELPSIPKEYVIVNIGGYKAKK